MLCYVMLCEPPTGGTERERQILGSRCAAAGPLGVAWPLFIPCSALMRKFRASEDFFLTNAVVCALPAAALAGAHAAGESCQIRYTLCIERICIYGPNSVFTCLLLGRDLCIRIPYLRGLPNPGVNTVEARLPVGNSPYSVFRIRIPYPGELSPNG